MIGDMTKSLIEIKNSIIKGIIIVGDIRNGEIGEDSA